MADSKSHMILGCKRRYMLGTKNPIQSQILKCAKEIEELESVIRLIVRPYLSELGFIQ